MADKCPEMITKRAGDESLDFCEMNGKVCLLVCSEECETWNEIQAEWKAEAAEKIARDKY